MDRNIPLQMISNQILNLYLQILDVLFLQQFYETEAKRAKGIQTENAINNQVVSK